MTSLRSSYGLPAVVVLLTACGSPSESTSGTSRLGPTSITGSVAGRTVGLADTVGIRTVSKDGSLDLMVLALEDRAGLCDLIRGPYEWASTGMNMTFTRTPPADGEMDLNFPPGTYTIGTATKTADSEVTLRASFYETDATCTNVVPEGSRSATAGTVTLVSVELGYAKGTYDLTFGTDRVHGSFEIPLCPALPGDATKKRTCEPQR